jgi:hypothetical protein
MALSQDEQRILAEIEQRLTSDDPGLASSLRAFRRPGPAKMLRSPRVRIVGSLFTVLLVAMVSVTIYAMIPFRALQSRQAPPPTAGAPANTAMSAATGNRPATARQSSAGSSTGPTKPTVSTASRTSAASGAGTVSATSTGQNSSSHSGASTAAASKPQQGKTGVTDSDLLPTANPNP